MLRTQSPSFTQLPRRLRAFVRHRCSPNESVEIRKLRLENAELKKRIATLTSKELPMTQPIPPVPVESATSIIERDGGVQWPSPDESPPFWMRSAREDVAVEDGVHGWDIEMASQLDAKTLYVIHVTAEMAPIAKVGGLADVVTGLSRASIARGHTVEVCLPYYECLPSDQIESLEEETAFECPKGYNWDNQLKMGSLKTHVWKGKIAGVQVFLIRPDWSESNLFKGGKIYGGGYNEAEAYLYFCRACLEFLKVTNRQPHVLHLHEWQAAAVSMLYWERYHHDGLDIPRIMFTIHNMDNSGECRQDEFSFTGVPGEVFATVDKALDERTIGHNPERLSLMKGALIYSNSVTTVSPTYAQEVLDEGAAGWLRSTVGRSEIRTKLQGILNGIDVDEWNPKTDVYLPADFSADSPQGKAICKEYLQKVRNSISIIHTDDNQDTYFYSHDIIPTAEIDDPLSQTQFRGLGLEVTTAKPLVSCITRLVPQKGIHLIKQGVHRTNELNGQFVLLGTGHADGDFRHLAEHDFKNSSDIKLLMLYSDALAHLIYAASDFVLVPSLFEPCGLTQMIAMRYGALPIVRLTGGLADTVHDLNQNPDGNGFGFGGVDEGSLNVSLESAMKLFRDRPKEWKAVSKKNMKLDFSWDASVQSYLDLYHSIAAF